MHADEWIDLFSRFTPELRNKLVVVLQNGGEIAVDAVIRFEPTYTVLRGRVAGTDNESRAFFVPYDQMTYLRIERVVKVSELQILYGEVPTAVERDLATEGVDQAPAAETPAAPAAGPASAPVRSSVSRSDQVRDKLLQRIRATRAGNKPDESQ